MSETLETELALFEEHRAEFFQNAPWKFALIRGRQLQGFYDTAENAYKAGVDAFGIEPFLIKQVLQEDQIHEIPAHYLGLTHAAV